ncbi:site-specific integrase [Ornithobacterium rhinotracheale]|uniref:site-specific integrase n=1 Tax=Ornithobacterium rhinotracheale TaxID=28251 RepID=UPI00129C78E8|nr:site-specific integrase [Ornithobacterium rhinotracheale]MRJ11324.1 site-specific integrase [Ornithobacterium rhinotracheale]
MKITLKKKKLKTGKISLYLEYYKGSYRDEQGKEKHNREFEYLKLYLLDKPKNQAEKKQNEETLKLAEKIRVLKEAEYIKGVFGMHDSKKTKINIFEVFDELLKNKANTTCDSNATTYISTRRLMSEYFHSSTVFSDLTFQITNGFKEYIDKHGTTKHGQPLKHGSKYSYLNRFITFLNYAYENGYIVDKSVTKISGFNDRPVQREYLTFDEVQALAKTDCKFPVMKRAFLFSCLTGLRWGDIHKLRWKNIRKQNGRHRIHFSQNKTKEIEYLPISNDAFQLLGKRKKDNELVFTNLKYGGTMSMELLRWCMRAGITKHITFHCARHTNAVLLLENGADIYTVQKRLGHKEIRTTQVYAKVLDSKMNEAADLIPNLKF